MTLISLLLVLAIERATSKTTYWQSDFYINRYTSWLEKRDILSPASSVQALLAMTIVPALILWLVLHQLDAFLLLLWLIQQY